MHNHLGPKNLANRLFSWTSIIVFLILLLTCGVLMLGCTLHSSVSEQGITLSILKKAEFE